MLLAERFRSAVGALRGEPGSPVWTLGLKALLEARIALDPAYFNGVVLPAAKATIVEAGALGLPMIDPEQTKENALLRLFWGLLFERWKPEPGGGSSVFLRGLSGRGPGNRRKKLFAAAMTPDLYDAKYRPKVRRFLDRVLDPANAGQPFMQVFTEAFPDLYWDLHLGLSGAAVPPDVRDVYTSFVTVFALRDPMDPQFYDHYANVRRKRAGLLAWIGKEIAALPGRPGADATFVHYWLANTGGGEACFTAADIAFECYTDFLAVSQWPLAAYLVVEQLGCEAEWRGLLHAAAGAGEPALRALATELFRHVCPNEQSMSPLAIHRGVIASKLELEIVSVVPHARSCQDGTLWPDPAARDPTRFDTVPTSAAVDEAHCKRLGLARSPFPPEPVPVRDGRDLVMTNSAFGTVYGVHQGTPMPVCDHAGFAPFGYGYRRCPGELLTLAVFADFLGEIARRGIIFADLELPIPPTVIVGPVPPVLDKYGFVPALPAAPEPVMAAPAHV